MFLCRPLASAASFAACLSLAAAAPDGLPSLTSRDGAAYTIYLDFGGFDFNGTWGNGSSTPGLTPAYGDAVGSFTSTQITDMQEIWGRVANQYAPFDVNVTTIDPAVAAGQAADDSQRLAYYDSVRNLTHTIVGGAGGWLGLAGGVSYVGVAPYLGSELGPGNGWHTDFAFSDTLAVYHPGTVAKATAAASAHEEGHTFGLWHQSDHNIPNQPENEYSRDGWTGTGDTYAGDGSYAPLMGVTYYSQRSSFRVGYSNDTGPAIQNDAAVIGTLPGMNGQVDDGIGHAFGSATKLALLGDTVDSTAARGVIVSADAQNPNPIGVDNYSKDYFKFQTRGGLATLTVRDGRNSLDPNVADPGATLNSDLEIFDSNFNLIGVGTRSLDTMSETYTGNFVLGEYFAVILSHGGYQSTFDSNAQYYDIGSYFITGTVAAVPEPAPFVGLGIGVLALAARRQRRTS